MNRIAVGLAIILALVTGYAMGRWGTRGDLNLKDREIARLSAGTDGKAKAHTTKHTSTTFHASRISIPVEATTPDIPETTNGPARRWGGFNRTNFVAQWQAQATSLRSNFFANANLTPEQQANFDSLFGAMNDTLKDRAAFWTAAITEGKIPRSEVEVRSRAEFSTTLARAYDGLDRSMPPNWRTAAGDNFSVMRFVDPSIFEAYHGLRGPRGGRGGGRPPPAQ